MPPANRSPFKSSNITLSAYIYDLVARRAALEQTTPDAVAEQLLARELDEDGWRQEFEALIRRVQARTGRFCADEIEADISAAAQQVREHGTYGPNP